MLGEQRLDEQGTGVVRGHGEIERVGQLTGPGLGIGAGGSRQNHQPESEVLDDLSVLLQPLSVLGMFQPDEKRVRRSQHFRSRF